MAVQGPGGDSNMARICQKQGKVKAKQGQEHGSNMARRLQYQGQEMAVPWQGD